jgi:hypothetical protein
VPSLSGCSRSQRVCSGCSCKETTAFPTRYELRSATIVTTNRGLPSWAELFGGDTVVAAAILDRLLDKATVINIKGPSWRLREHGALTKPLADMTDPPERPEPNGRPPRRRG